MKRAIFAVFLCIGSAVSAEQPRPASTVDHAKSAQDAQQRRAAIREHMGQLQLDMLVNDIVAGDEQARNDPRRADQMVASSAR